MVIDIEMSVSSVLIIDAMCVVNMVSKTLEMTNAMHFAKKLVAIVSEMSKTNYEEIRIVFINMCQILWKKLLETSEQQNNTDPLPCTRWY